MAYRSTFRGQLYIRRYGASRPTEIFQPGQCTVLPLNEIDERDQQVVVATLLRRLNKARMDTERGKVHSGESYLPYPAFVLIEEAHHFAPGGAEVVSTAILKI